jgi:hypothetical protein
MQRSQTKRRIIGDNLGRNILDLMSHQDINGKEKMCSTMLQGLENILKEGTIFPSHKFFFLNTNI